MKTWGIILLFLSCLYAKATAQETKEPDKVAVGTAIYAVTDMVNKRSRLEAWEVRLPMLKGRRHVKPYTVLKGAHGQTLFQETRSDGIWSDETRTEGLDTYLFERYHTHPSWLSPGESSFGYVEERKKEDDTIVLSWPIFFGVEEGEGGRFRLIMKAYLPRGGQFLIIREYLPGQIFMPLQESHELTEGGEVLLHFVYARIL